LQVVEPGTIQALDAIGSEQISVGDERCNRAAAANPADDVIEFGVQQGLTAANGDHGRAQLG
jgi:hypothetical protein